MRSKERISLKKRRVALPIVLALLAIAVVLGVAFTYASVVNTMRAHNTLTSGTIEIALNNPASQAQYSLGDTVERTYTVTNEEEPSYIRIKPYIESENTSGKAETVLPPTTSGKWVQKNDGYWYYTEPVLNGGSIDYTTRFAFVEHPEWIALFMDSDEISLTEKVVAEAVQAANWSPDFGASAPWGDQTVTARNGVVVS